MKKINYLIICLVLLSTTVTTAQYGIGTDTPSPKAILDLTSTEKGLLIPRMTSAQRDLIISPENALLIFNINNNTFEVFKSSCSCWVAINDNGNTPASNVVNTPPTAISLNYTGSFVQGKTATLIYTYADSQSDAEGLSTFVWQRATTNNGLNLSTIPNAPNSSYTFQSADLGLFVRCGVVPRAQAGALNGVITFGAWFQVENNTVPQANSLVVSGTPAVANSLNASYTFSGGNGTEDTTPTLSSTVNAGTLYNWQAANTNTGVNVFTANLYGNFAFSNTYVPQNDLLGRYIRVGVRPKDTSGLQATNFVYSPWIGPITTGIEEAPIAQNVSYSPTPGEGIMITGSYTFYDLNNDPELASTYKWYRANDALGNGAVLISGANSINYTGSSDDIGKYIGFSVTPKAGTGTNIGAEVIYYSSTPSLPLAKFMFTSSAIKHLPFFFQNRTMNEQNSIDVEIDVETAGGIVFSSAPVNGYIFNTNFIASNIGIQRISLLPIGTQTSYNSTGDSFTLYGVGQSTQNKVFTIANTLSGINMTSHYNGINGSNLSVDPSISTYNTGQIFSNNGTCLYSAISAGHTSGTCSGTVTLDAVSYGLVLINGQCWFNRSIRATPINFSSLTPTSWLVATISDVGNWGFYNTATTTGSAGWGTSEPGPNTEGYLYQFSAAMNNDNYERAKGVCPLGYHIPSDCEWMYLEHGLGMSLSEQNVNIGYRSATSVNDGAPGNKLRTVAGYSSTGFNSLLAGSRGNTGVFSGRGGTAFYWSSTTSSGTSVFVRRTRGDFSIGRNAFDKSNAYNVRCLKD